MPARAQNVMDKIAGSAALAAISRIGMPLLLAAATWSAATLIGLDRRVAMLEGVGTTERAEVIRRITELEQSDRRDRELINAMRADLAAMRADQIATLRTVERLERVLAERGR